jgi:hypothetical protein
MYECLSYFLLKHVDQVEKTIYYEEKTDRLRLMKVENTRTWSIME